MVRKKLFFLALILVVRVTNDKSLGVTIPSHFVENFEDLLLGAICKDMDGLKFGVKNTILPEHAVYNFI